MACRLLTDMLLLKAMPIYDSSQSRSIGIILKVHVTPQRFSNLASDWQAPQPLASQNPWGPFYAAGKEAM